jgi:hypothetical protein
VPHLPARRGVSARALGRPSPARPCARANREASGRSRAARHPNARQAVPGMSSPARDDRCRPRFGRAGERWRHCGVRARRHRRPYPQRARTGRKLRARKRALRAVPGKKALHLSVESRGLARKASDGSLPGGHAPCLERLRERSGRELDRPCPVEPGVPRARPRSRPRPRTRRPTPSTIARRSRSSRPVPTLARASIPGAFSSATAGPRHVTERARRRSSPFTTAIELELSCEPRSPHPEATAKRIRASSTPQTQGRA